MLRIDHQARLKAFDLLQELKGEGGISRKELIDRVNSEFGIPIGTLYAWHRDEYLPWGRAGGIAYRPELFYVLGALLGDGCLYRWKITNNYLILIGDQKFATKYAAMVTQCTGVKNKAYIDRSKNIWFVRSNNFELYSLFKRAREDLVYLEELIRQGGKKATLLFIEGFFDAEGCVKIIKEPVRKTPKICLDITNTNLGILNLIKRLLKECLDIESKYSVQKPSVGKDGSLRRKAYHLRIYKKEYIARFLENISTTKLREEKTAYVRNWLNNGL